MATDLASGRSSQKQRTRQALIDAVNRLLDQGAVPTLDQVAEEATVSRATAYRYYRSINELLADAYLGRRLATPKDVLAGVSEDPTDRLLAVEAAVNGELLKDEQAVHLTARVIADQWLESDHQGVSSRPGRRLPFIDAALETLDGVTPANRRRLRNAAALVIGMEAVISLRDVCGLSHNEARATARWALEALVAHAQAKPKKAR